jgi:transcriptional regulator with XRE-family HTH domain
MRDTFASITVWHVPASHAGTRLRRERRRLDITQDRLAFELGTGRTSVWQYETGKAQLRADQLQSLAALGMDVQYILFGASTAKQQLSVVRKGACIELQKRGQQVSTMTFKAGSPA